MKWLRGSAINLKDKPDPKLVTWLSAQEYVLKRPYTHYKNSIATLK